MKGWILYKKKQADITDSDFGVTRLLKEAEELGIEMSVHSPEQFELIVSRSGKRSVLIDDVVTELPDFVLPRMGSGTGYFALAVLRQLENLNIYTCNSSRTIEVVKDKLQIHQLLAQSNLPTPKTMLLKFPIDIKIVKREIGFPLIIKNITGTEGRGIYLCDSPEKFQDIMELMYSYNKNMNIIIQEYVGHRRGEDLRVFVMGGKVVACMRRIAKDGGFKANFSLGATVEEYKIDSEIEHLALETAKLLKLDVTGIDILFDETGYKVLEANSSPGFKGLELATKKNIAREILTYVTDKVAQPVS